MVGVSYHELNANTPRSARHTAGERKQFLVVCVIGVAVLLNAFINAGLFEPVVVKDGVYPGGEFMYKLVEDKDYAATGGLWRRIRRDLRTEHHLEDDKSFDKDLYAVFIDVDSSNIAGTGRFFTGVLNADSDTRQRILDVNGEVSKRDVNDEKYTKFDFMEYDIENLPNAKCAVATFPYTDGFVSALLHNYKVFPALVRHARALSSGGKLVISMTCNREKQMCTHYITLEEGEKFLLGHPDTSEYSGSSLEAISFNPDKVMKGLKKLVGMREEL